jgi:hypothetical protein
MESQLREKQKQMSEDLRLTIKKQRGKKEPEHQTDTLNFSQQV